MYSNQQPQIDPKLAAAIALLQAPDAPAPNTVVGRMASGVMQQEAQKRMADMQAAKMQMGVAAPLLAQQAERAKMQEMAQMVAQMQGQQEPQGFASGGPTLGSGPIVELNRRADEYGLPNVSIYDSPEKRAAKIQRIQAAIASGPPEKARVDRGSVNQPNEVLERVGPRSEFPISETYEPGYEKLPPSPTAKPTPQPLNKGIAQVLRAKQQPAPAVQPAPQAPAIVEPTIQDAMNSAQRMVPDVDRSGINALLTKREGLSQQRQGLVDSQLSDMQRIREEIQRNRAVEDDESKMARLSNFLAGLGAGGMGGAGRAAMGFNEQIAAQRKARIGEDAMQAEKVALLKAKALAEQMGDVDQVIKINEELAKLDVQNAGHMGSVTGNLFGTEVSRRNTDVNAKTQIETNAATNASQERQNAARIAGQLQAARIQAAAATNKMDLNELRARATMLNNDPEVRAKKEFIKQMEPVASKLKPGNPLYEQYKAAVQFIHNRAIQLELDPSDPRVAATLGMSPVQAAPQAAPQTQQNRSGWGKATIVQ